RLACTGAPDRADLPGADRRHRARSAGPVIRAGECDGDDGLVGGRGAHRRAGFRCGRPGRRTTDRHRRSRRRGRDVTTRDEQVWQRLSPRMLLVHPVHEVLRQIPLLIGSVVLGSATGNPLWTLYGLALVVGYGVARWFT